MASFTCTKEFKDFPFAHRQPNHKGHCSLIHGHNWSFSITFVCDKLDENLFVVDFGELKWVKAWLEEKFDHTLVLNTDDPFLNHLGFHLQDATDRINPENKQCRNLAKIVTVPNCGAEGLAQFVYGCLNAKMSSVTASKKESLLTQEALDDYVRRGVRVLAVTVHEDSKNSASYQPL